MADLEVEVVNHLGLHVRACSKLVDCAGRFSSTVTLYYVANQANAKRIIEVMSLGASFGSTVKIVAEGEDEEDALQALQQLFAKGFGEI